MPFPSHTFPSIRPSLAGPRTSDELAAAARDSPGALAASVAIVELLPEAVGLLRKMAGQVQAAAAAASSAVLTASISVCIEAGDEGVVEALEMLACSCGIDGLQLGGVGGRWRGRLKHLLRREFDMQRRLLRAQRLDWGCLCTMSTALASQGAVPACWNPGCGGSAGNGAGRSSSSGAEDKDVAAAAGGGACKGCGHAFFCCKQCEVEAGKRGHSMACELLQVL